MKRTLLLCLALLFSTVACWDDVDNIKGDSTCVHVDFYEGGRYGENTAPIDGIYCRRDP